ncbi:MAG TPA: hypothetical protein VIQ54_07580 [Polyangia bacterium]
MARALLALALGVLACGSSSLPSSPGTAGSAGTGGTGGGGTGGNCRTAEEFRPGQCDPTFAQQLQRQVPGACDYARVYTGTCAGTQVWNLTYQSLGDWVWCLFDSNGALTGEVICSDVIGTNCGPCYYSGNAPSSPPTMQSCPALTAMSCDSRDGGADR